MEKNLNFVSYEIALELNALGFDEECFAYYYNCDNGVHDLCIYQDEDYTYIDDGYNDEYWRNTIIAPLIQQAVEYLESEFSIYIFVSMDSVSHKFNYDIHYETRNIKNNGSLVSSVSVNSGYNYDSRIESQSNAILKAIELYKKCSKI